MSLSSRLAAVLLPLLAAVLALAAAVPAQCGTAWSPLLQGEPIATPRGTVQAQTSWDPDGAGPLPACLVVGGAFAVANQALCHVAYHDGATWTAMPQLPLPQPSAVEVVALTVFNGQLIALSKGVVCRWNGATWDFVGSTGLSQSTTTYYAAAVYQGELYVAGNFINADPITAPNVSARGIARWNGATWSTVGPNSNNFPVVRALAVFNNVLYAGGGFTGIAGVTASNLAAWNGTAWSAAGDPNGIVDSLVTRSTFSLASTQLFAGGRFTQIGGALAQGVARLAASPGSVWTAMNGLPAAQAQARVELAVRSSGLTGYVLSSFTGDQVRTWNGTAWIDDFQVPAAEFGMLGMHNGRTFVGRTSADAPAAARDALAFGPFETIYGAGICGRVYAVAEYNGQPVIGGDFQRIGTTVCNGLAIRTASGWQPFAGGVTGGIGSVRALVPNGNILYVAGSFSVATGGVAENIAAYSGGAWQPLGNGLNGTVSALVQRSNGWLYAGGSFTASGASPTVALAAFNGATWAAVNGGLDFNIGPSWVDHLAIDGTTLYVAGRFTIAGYASLVVNNFAACSLTPTGGWQALYRTGSATPGVSEVTALGLTPNGVGVAYKTTDPNWQSIGRVAGNAITTFATSGITVLRANDVRGIVGVPGATYFLHRGTFEEIQGLQLAASTAEALVRFDGAGISTPSSATLETGALGAMAHTLAGDLLVGGLATAANVVRGGFGQLRPSCPAAALAYGASCGSPSSAVAPASVVTSLPYLGGSYRVETSGISGSVLNVAIVAVGLQQVAVPLAAILPVGGACSLLADPVATLNLLPTAGVVRHEVPIPSAPSLVGVQLYDQVLRVDFGTNGIDGVAAAQAHRLTVGRGV